MRDSVTLFLFVSVMRLACQCGLFSLTTYPVSNADMFTLSVLTKLTRLFSESMFRLRRLGSLAFIFYLFRDRRVWRNVSELKFVGKVLKLFYLVQRNCLKVNVTPKLNPVFSELFAAKIPRDSLVAALCA